MKKSLFILTALIMVLALVLTACGGGATPEAEQPAEEAPAEEAPAEEAPAEEAPAMEEKVLIRWFVGLGTGTDPAQVVEQQAVVDAFNVSQDRIEVILEVVPYESGRDTLSTQIAAGNGPDIVGPVGIGGSNDFYGQWMDLTPLMEAANYDTSVFNEALVEFYQTEEGQVGLPWMVFPTGLYYNPSLFDEAGMNYPPANIGDPYVWVDGTEEEWNWNTLAEVAKQLTVDVNGLTPLDDGFDRDNIVQVGYFPQWSGAPVTGTFWEYGTGWAGEAGAYTADIPQGWYDSWKWQFEGIWGDEPFIPNGALAGSAEFGAGNVMNSGRGAMAQTQLWFTCCVNDTDWDVAAFPASPTTGELLGRMDADTVRMWKGTTHPAEAFEFLTWLIGPGGTEPLIMGIGSVEPGYAAYGGFPALTEYQTIYWETKAEQFPNVTNWQVFDQALAYPDNPSAEAWRPNSVETVSRMDAFKSLWENDSTIDFDAEFDKLVEELEVIYNK